MARGGVYTTGYGLTGAAGGVGSGVRRSAEVEAANRSVSSGGDAVEAVGRVQNAGGGVIRVGADQLHEVLGTSGRGVAQASDGSIIFKAPGSNEVKVVSPDGTVKSAGAAQVAVGKSGVDGLRIGGTNYVIARTRVDITKNIKDGLISINLPPSLRGAAYDKDGNLNGWKLNAKAITDKAVRAAAYRLMSKEGVLRIPKDSPVYAKLEARLSKAGYSRDTIGAINQLFNETENFRYKAGDAEQAKQLAAAFGASQRKSNEAAG
jgi:hypothetical protein